MDSTYGWWINSNQIKSRIIWSSTNQGINSNEFYGHLLPKVVLWSMYQIQTNQSFNVQFQSNQTQNHLVFDLKLINQFKTNQFQNHLVFHLMSMNQIQKTVVKSIPNEPIPESYDLDLMTTNHNLLAINQIKTNQIQKSLSHVLHIISKPASVQTSMKMVVWIQFLKVSTKETSSRQNNRHSHLLSAFHIPIFTKSFPIIEQKLYQYPATTTI